MSICLTILSVMCFAGVAHSQDHSLSLQGGFFRPWDQGENGGSTAIQYLRRAGERSHFGMEFGYRNFEGKVFNVELPVHTIRVTTVYRYDIIKDSFVTPYAGIGLGVAVNLFNGNKIERRLKARNPLPNDAMGKPQTNTFEAPSIGAGLDMFGMLGVDVKMPGAEWISLFTEARFSYTPQFSQIETSLPGDDDDDIDVDNFGGFEANAGIRFSF